MHPKHDSTALFVHFVFHPWAAQHIAYDRWEDPNLVDRLLSRHASMLTKSITLVPLLIHISICQEKRFCESLPPRPLELRTWILSLFPWSRAFLMHSASLRLFVPTPVSQQAEEVYLCCTGNDYLASLCERSSNTVTGLQKRIHLCKTSLTWTLEV